MLNKKKLLMITLFLFIALLISSITSVAVALRDSNKVKQQVVRLHIIAHSDSESDQELKLQVRDSILQRAGDIFKGATNAEDALEIARNNTDLIATYAKEEIVKQGFTYDVQVMVDTVYFPTREYDNSVRLPAGNYNAVKVVIGSGKGKNWWCVLFPSVCLPSSIKTNPNKMKDVLSGSALSLTKPAKTSGAKLRFKSVEIINEWFHKFTKNK